MIQHKMEDYLILEDEVINIKDTIRYSAKKEFSISMCHFYLEYGIIEITTWNEHTKGNISDCRFYGIIEGGGSALSVKTRLLSRIVRNRFKNKGSK